MRPARISVTYAALLRRRQRWRTRLTTSRVTHRRYRPNDSCAHDPSGRDRGDPTHEGSASCHAPEQCRSNTLPCAGDAAQLARTAFDVAAHNGHEATMRPTTRVPLSRTAPVSDHRQVGARFGVVDVTRLRSESAIVRRRFQGPVSIASVTESSLSASARPNSSAGHSNGCDPPRRHSKLPSSTTPYRSSS